MAQHYSDPARESDTYSLPDVETWEDRIVEVQTRCGVFEVCRSIFDANPPACPSCERESCFIASAVLDRSAWFYWTCFPGCMPDSDPNGPFDTEQEAIDDAQTDARESADCAVCEGSSDYTDEHCIGCGANDPDACEYCGANLHPCKCGGGE